MNWNSSILWGIIGIFSTIFFGFIFSYIFYRKSLKQKKMVCITEPTTLISDNLSNYKNLKILYNDENIQTLTSTQVVFKNIGNDKIEPSDITPSDPIVITTSGKFLSTEDNLLEVQTTNPKVKSNLEYVDDSTFNLKFDFFPPECELSVTLLHSGDISITGDLKVGDFKQNNKNNTSNINKPRSDNMFKFMGNYINAMSKICFIFSIMYLVLLALSPNDNTTLFLPESVLIFPIMGILLIILFTLINKFDKKVQSKYENDK